MNKRRFIEAGFPLREASLDSVHEKNVRHGHISTLHIWPARRPLAACRAALLATLLPDPGTKKGRRELRQRIGGRIEEVPGAGGRMKEQTVGGILHWKREGDSELDALRNEIREAFGGRTPRVMDPFAGGGAIPLEAMRLGCDVVASDLNPVAWFILRCTLHYPRLIGSETRPLPAFVAEDAEFQKAFRKAHRIPARRRGAKSLFAADGEIEADFAWHLRAWGRRVLARARKRLAARYPTYAAFEPVRRKGRARRVGPERPFTPRERQFLEPDADGVVSADALNRDFDRSYVADDANPRWVAKPVVAYLWARTAPCGGCRAEIPLLKTRWLCRKGRKRILLTMELRSDASGVEFGIERDVPPGPGSPAQRREHDKRLGAGTMSRSGATCPCCGAVMTMSDLRSHGKAGRLGERMTAVVVDGQQGKEYRPPTQRDIEAARVGEDELAGLYREIPFGLPNERTPEAGALGIRVPRYGFDRWRTLFTDRQLLTLGTCAQEIRATARELDEYPDSWKEALVAYLALTMSRLADRGSSLATWTNNPEKIRSTFARFALPMVWDFAESCPLTDTTGGFGQAVEWVARVLEHTTVAVGSTRASVEQRSATDSLPGSVDVICTDPPYYDAIPYSDLMDFFQVWLRRVLLGLSPEADAVFADPLGPKWNSERNEGELIDDAARFGGDREASKRNYEDGMERALARFRDALADDGRLIVVFASKSPDAWETLVSALIRSGFVVCGSWPIQTEMANRQRSLTGAALSSSIWLVARKRTNQRPGWDLQVLDEMRSRITERLRDFWDAGIRGPDFVWSATGPALEAFSRHPVVRRQDAPGETLSVPEFLRHVRRMVVDFAVGRVLDPASEGQLELDDVTTYYLLHRKDFGLDAAPAGAVILYALSCGVRDGDLTGRRDLLAIGKGSSAGTMRLKAWSRRKSRSLGEPDANGATPALVDSLHKVMQLWKTGEQSRVDGYLEARGLWSNTLFARVVQAVLDQAAGGTEERSLLESVQNHLSAKGGRRAPRYVGRI